MVSYCSIIKAVVFELQVTLLITEGTEVRVAITHLTIGIVTEATVL